MMFGGWWVLFGYGWVPCGDLMGGNLFNVGHFLTISMITIQAFTMYVHFG